MYIDYVEIYVKAGNGGRGAVSFRREKYVPKGGPDGGDGGKGGDVILLSDPNISTLLDFRYRRKYIAENGEHGMGAMKTGKNGRNIVLRVPVGTVVKDKETGVILFDFTESYQEFIVAIGGKGGRGNTHFKSPTNQAPRIAETGQTGEEKKIILELKLIADVGIVGFPNAGKSTLISVISKAKPKIADYPFTTLEPVLGLVKYKDFESFIVADIPGIIEGASQGKGLGLKFLRHIERTRILLFLISADANNIVDEYKILIKELKYYSKTLINKTKILAISKMDLIPDDEKETFKSSVAHKIKTLRIKAKPEALVFISSVLGYGVGDLITILAKTLKKEKLSFKVTV